MSRVRRRRSSWHPSMGPRPVPQAPPPGPFWVPIRDELVEFVSFSPPGESCLFCQLEGIHHSHDLSDDSSPVEVVVENVDGPPGETREPSAITPGAAGEINANGS